MPNDMQAMPEIGESTRTNPDVTKLSFLSASWVNERIIRVAEQVDKYVGRIIDQGMLVDGWGPFESPITDEILSRLTPDQFRGLFDSEPTIEGKAALVARMKNLKLDIQALLPTEASLAAMMLAPPLEAEPANALSSSEAPV